MKTAITTVFVNLQQGFIIDDMNNIVGAYSHHHKAVVIKVPWHSNDFEWTGTLFENYEMINKATDSFSINCYTEAGDKELSELIMEVI